MCISGRQPKPYGWAGRAPRPRPPSPDLWCSVLLGTHVTMAVPRAVLVSCRYSSITRSSLRTNRQRGRGQSGRLRPPHCGTRGGGTGRGVSQVARHATLRYTRERGQGSIRARSSTPYHAPTAAGRPTQRQTDWRSGASPPAATTVTLKHLKPGLPSQRQHLSHITSQDGGHNGRAANVSECLLSNQ